MREILREVSIYAVYGGACLQPHLEERRRIRAEGHLLYREFEVSLGKDPISKGKKKLQQKKKKHHITRKSKSNKLCPFLWSVFL